MQPKTPTVLKLARGNPGKRPIEQNEAKPEQASNLTPPTGMTAQGKKHWVEIVEHLHRCGLYTVADEDTLRTYCEYFAQWLEANRMVKRLGAVVGEDANGNLVKFSKAANIEKFPRVNPWVKVSNEAFNKLSKLIPHLGLSPAARSSLSVIPPGNQTDGDDDFNDL